MNRNQDVEYSTLRLNQDQAELLEMLSTKCDEATAMLESAVNNVTDLIILGEATKLNEGMHEVKDKLNKAWKAIVEFFKKCARYIKEKLQGKVHDLNLKFIAGEKNEDAKIEFYTKMKKFKTMEINKNDKLECVLVGNVQLIIETLVKYVKTGEVDTGKIGAAAAEAVDKFTSEVEQNLRKIYEKCADTAVNLGATGVKGSVGTGEIYSVIRDVVKVEIEYSPRSIQLVIDMINRFYQKAIDAIYKISAKVIKNAKKAPDKTSYKYYVIAKNVSNTCLNASTLIKVKE